jgi:ribosomal protein S12 methylthiotransferase accessory factor
VTPVTPVTLVTSAASLRSGLTAEDPPASCLLLERLILQRLRAQARPGEPWPADVTIAVSTLGTRDEFSPRPPAPADGATGRVIPVHIYGGTAIVGPLRAGERPGQPCARCVARSWQAIQPEEVREALELGGATNAAGRTPYLTPFVVDALAALIAAAAVTGNLAGEDGRDQVFQLNLENRTATGVPLAPDPDCPACGRPDAGVPVIELEPVAKPTATSFRPRSLGDIAIPAAALANPVCGLLGTEPSPDLASPSTSAAYGRFLMRSGGNLHKVGWAGHASSFGVSKAVGILEALERYAGMRPRPGRAIRLASLRALREQGERVLDPRECGVYSAELYAHDTSIPPFSEDREIAWTWGYSLRDNAPVLVPEVFAFYHGTPAADRFVQESSNGCALGSSLSEAVYFGLMEAIERDAFLLTWYGQAVLPEINPRSSKDRTTREMVDRLEMHGYIARFFDARIGFPIPVVIAVATRADGGLGATCFSAGASLDPESALRAGLEEIATDAVYLRGRTESRFGELNAMADDFGKVRELRDHPLLYGLPRMSGYAGFLLDKRNGSTPGDLADVYARPPVPLQPREDIRDDVRQCVDVMTRGGFDVIVVDQTFPLQRDLGLRTVKVIVPGLLPIDFGWHRQRALLLPRLRTALHQAGLRDRDLTPSDFNPAPHPFP